MKSGATLESSNSASSCNSNSWSVLALRRLRATRPPSGRTKSPSNPGSSSASERVAGGVAVRSQASRPMLARPVLNATVEMNGGELRSLIKGLLVTELNLKGRDPATIEDDAPFFGGGLGLDSLDA